MKHSKLVSEFKRVDDADAVLSFAPKLFDRLELLWAFAFDGFESRILE